MTEDSGAFKTKSANSRQIPPFVTFRKGRCNEASPAKETFPPARRALKPPIFNKRRQAVAVF
jgi:hypothetical protein